MLPHRTRFVGLYLLLPSQRGTIPADWAKPAGIGDTIIATGALLLVVLGTPRGPLLLWNVLGLLDILGVVGLAMRVGLKDWPSMVFLRELPLGLLPTFLVPVIIATHVLIFVRLMRGQARRD